MTDEMSSSVRAIIVEVAAGTTCVCGKVLDRDLRIRLGRNYGKGRGRWRLTRKIKLGPTFGRVEQSAHIAANYALACSSECARSIEQSQQVIETLTED